MPVVINDFEVMPAPPANENQRSDKKTDEAATKKPEMSDYEVAQMLKRRMERWERISAH